VEPKPYVKDSSNRDQVRDAQRKVRFKREDELNDIRDLLTLPSGQRFLWRYLEVCGVFRSSWSPSAEIHFNEGRRDIGLRILADITEADPKALITLMSNKL